MLFKGRQSLFHKVFQIAMIYFDLKSHSGLLIKVRGITTWVSTTPIHVPKVSHLRTKGLVKSSTTRTGVEHMAFCKEMKDFSTGSSQLKVFFFGSPVKGLAIFP